MDESVDLDALALATAGLVGSDLANMINEAAINAVKNGRQLVNQKDLFEAVEVVQGGKEKKDRIMSDKREKSSHTMRLDMHLYQPCRKTRACTENHNRTTYHGSTRIYTPDTGRGEIP